MQIGLAIVLIQFLFINPVYYLCCYNLTLYSYLYIVLIICGYVNIERIILKLNLAFHYTIKISLNKIYVYLVPILFDINL